MPDLFVAPDQEQTSPVIEESELTPSHSQQTNLVSKRLSSILAPTLYPVGMFATYRENPSNITFGAQEPSEKVLLFLRRAFISNIPWITAGIALLLAPTFFIVLANVMNVKIVSIPFNFSLILQALYYLFVTTYIFVNFIDWFFNASLITNVRVMDIDYENLFYKHVSETKLDLVQDVSYTQAGFSQTVYNYGDVLIQTAATVDSFKLTKVPKPQRIVEVVEELIGKEEEKNVT